MPGYPQRYNGLADCLRQTYSDREGGGVRALYRGILPPLVCLCVAKLLASLLLLAPCFREVKKLSRKLQFTAEVRKAEATPHACGTSATCSSAHAAPHSVQPTHQVNPLPVGRTASPA